MKTVNNQKDVKNQDGVKNTESTVPLTPKIQNNVTSKQVTKPTEPMLKEKGIVPNSISISNENMLPKKEKIKPINNETPTEIKPMYSE